MKLESPENLDTAENEYNQEVSENEIENLQKEIEEKIEAKAEELGISEKKLIDLAGLDLESLEAEKLKELNLRQGELNFIRSDIGAAINEFNKENVDEAIIEFGKNKKKGGELGDEGLQDKRPLKASGLDKMLEFVEKHKKVVSVGELALYLSSYGMPALDTLAGNDAKVEIDGEKISLRDLVDNPELMKMIKSCDYNTPLDIAKAYNPAGAIYCDGGYLSLEIYDNGICFDKYDLRTEDLNKLKNDLGEIGITMGRTDSNSLGDFSKNKEQIIDIVARDLNISQSEIREHIDRVLLPDISRVSIVKFDNFSVNKGLKDSEFENFKKMEKDNFYLDQFEDIDKFEKPFLELLNEKGYSLEKIKEIAEGNPEKVIEIISEVIGEGIEYDEERAEQNWKERSKSAQLPSFTLEKEKGVCVDYAEAFTSAKYFLTEEGVPNFDKFIVLYTGSSGMNHAFNIIATIDSNGSIIVSFIDPTWYDSGEELNAVDEAHYYSRIKELAIRSIQEAMKKFAIEEKLREMLTQYDPRSHKRGRKIIGNKELYEVNKDIEIPLEEMEKIAKS